MNSPLPNISGYDLKSFELRNELGASLTVLNYGARITSLLLPTASAPKNIVLGYKSPADYLTDPFYLGATVGRYANRIANGQFELNGKKQQLSVNDKGHHLHGGTRGLAHQLWYPHGEVTENCLTLRHISEHDEQGYPGRADLRVSFHLSNNNMLSIIYEADVDRDTYINLTNHSYFNLNGDEQSANGHKLRIAADHFTPTDNALIPTGRFESVKGTSLDFGQRKTVRDMLNWPDKHLRREHGFDHNFVLRQSQQTVAMAASLTGEKSGITMQLYTSCPGLQFYGGSQLGAPFMPCQGICLEPQYFPDAPNQSAFKAPLARPGETHVETTHLQFDLSKAQ